MTTERIGLAKLIALRDSSVKAQMLNLMLPGLPPDQFDRCADELDRAFEKANEVLCRTLEIIVGSEEAHRIMGAIADEVESS